MINYTFLTIFSKTSANLHKPNGRFFQSLKLLLPRLFFYFFISQGVCADTWFSGLKTHSPEKIFEEGKYVPKGQTNDELEFSQSFNAIFKEFLDEYSVDGVIPPFFHVCACAATLMAKKISKIKGAKFINFISLYYVNDEGRRERGHSMAVFEVKGEYLYVDLRGFHDRAYVEKYWNVISWDNNLALPGKAEHLFNSDYINAKDFLNKLEVEGVTTGNFVNELRYQGALYVIETAWSKIRYRINQFKNGILNDSQIKYFFDTDVGEYFSDLKNYVFGRSVTAKNPYAQLPSSFFNFCEEKNWSILPD